MPLAVLISLLLNAQAVNITVDSMAVNYTFGRQMTFSVAAHADADITSAALLVRVGADSRTEVIEANFTPSPTIKAQVARDLQAEPIPPFSPVIYSWRLTDASGQTFTTPEQTQIYEDNRFNWQGVGRGAITAHWYEGDLAFGQRVADLGFEAVSRVSRFLSAPPPKNIDVYVYASASDLQAGLQLGGRTWVGGHADPALGVILVAGSPDADGLLSLERDVPHELAHVLVYQLTAPGYSRMPAWLDEGLAVNAELHPNPDYAVALSRAAESNALIPLSSLCGAFGVDPSRALLSYAQSQSVVRYILDRWGPQVMSALLAAYREGTTCEGGVQRVLGLTLPELQAGWQRDALETNPLLALARQALPALFVFCIPALVIAALIITPKKR